MMATTQHFNSTGNIFGDRQRAFAHAQRRMKERFNLEISPEVISEMEDQILYQSAKFINRVGGKRQAWYVEWCDVRFPVVYDPAIRSIITFLPPKFDLAPRRHGLVN